MHGPSEARDTVTTLPCLVLKGGDEKGPGIQGEGHALQGRVHARRAPQGKSTGCLSPTFPPVPKIKYLPPKLLKYQENGGEFLLGTSLTLCRVSTWGCWNSPSRQHIPKVPQDWDETFCQLGAGQDSSGAGIPSWEGGT